MSQDEALRMAAEVIDKSTGPLKGIAATLRGVAREGQAHSETLAKGMNRVEAGMKGAASAASTVLSPALATVGITGLSLTATIAGIGAAMRSFGGNAKELGQLSRDTGIAASTLRNVQGVLSAVGIDAATSGQALQKFAEEARLAHQGFGPLMEFLRRQGKDESGRKYFNDIADGIMRSKDAGEAYLRALRGQEGIKDPVERRIYADNVLKLGDAARLADGRLGSLNDQIKRYQRNNGVISDQDIQDAEDYARAMDGLQGTMNKLYNAAARELTPTLTDAARAVKSFMDDQRNGVQSEVVKTIRAIKDELAAINWKQAGTDALGFLRSTTALAGSLAQSLHTAAEALRALEKGDIAEALRRSTGGAGTVGRLVNKFYPRPDASTPLDEQLDAQMRGQDLSADQLREHQNLRSNAPRVAEIEARQAEIRGKLDQFGLMQKGGTDSERSRQTAEDLRREMTRLTDELKRIREGSATVQQQSFDATGGGFGGLIQNASYGGGGLSAVRQMLRGGGGIYAPRGDYGAGGGDASEGGGLNLYGGPSGGGRPRGPSLPRPDSPAGQVGRQLRGGDGVHDAGMLDLITRAEGTVGRGYSDSFAHQVPGDLTGKTLGEIEQIQRGMRGSSAIGRYQFMRGTLFGRRDGGLVGQLGLSRDEKFTPDLQDRLANALIERRYQEAKRTQSRNGGDFMRHFRTALAREWASFPGDYGQRGINGGMYPGQRASIGRDRLTASAQRWLDLREGRATTELAGRSPTGSVDQPSFQEVYRTRQASEDERAKALELRPAARSALQNSLRGGTVGATQAAERALMDVRIHNPGPNTRASVVAKGSLFGEVKQVTGRQMRSSDDI